MTLTRALASLSAALGLVLIAGVLPVTAVPGTHVFVDDARCDPHTITLTHELGEAPGFPAAELISAVAAGPLRLPLTCPTLPPGELPDDFLVTITNLSPFSWIDLFFVADAGILFGNVDGVIDGGLAFKIDVEGINSPLMSESGEADLIFTPGESWTFVVQAWKFPAPPDIMGSIGVGEASDDATGTSWSSIVAICLDCERVPAPTALALLALGATALAVRAGRRR